MDHVMLMGLIGQIAVYIVVFIFGICIGSFLNVCIFRLPAGESLTKKNSHCMTCGAEIKRYDLIPIISWLFVLKGKCRSCGEKISGRYPLVEFLNGILYVFVFMKFDMFSCGVMMPILTCLFISTLIVIGFEDYDTQEMTVGVLVIMAVINIIAVILALPQVNVIYWGMVSLKESLIGAAAISVPFLLIGFVLTPLFAMLTDENRSAARKLRKRLKELNSVNVKDKREIQKVETELAKIEAEIKEQPAVFGFGMGDIVLMAAAGIYLGWKRSLVAAGAGILIGAVYGLIQKKRSSESQFAFGPWLAIGIAIAIFFGNDIVYWYSKLLTFPISELTA